MNKIEKLLIEIVRDFPGLVLSEPGFSAQELSKNLMAKLSELRPIDLNYLKMVAKEAVNAKQTG